MIRVLHVLGGLNLGGAETMVMNLYRAIDKNKIQFDFIIHLPAKQAYEDEILKLGGKIYRFPQFKGKNIISQKRLWGDFFKIHREYQILHSHVRSYASVFLPIAKKYGLKTIIHSHSTSNGKGVSSCIKTIMQYPLRFQADYFFGCSQEAGQWLFGKKVVESDRYYMLQNAIDVSKYTFNPEIRSEYRNLLEISDDKKVYVHVGRLHEAKNHLFLLEVFYEIQKRNPNSLLLVVGDGDLKSVIEKKIKELKIEEYVLMLGARNDVAHIFQAADYFLFPSKWEGLPVTVVEAQASGIPCFVSNTVTKDVNLSQLVINLPIDKGTDIWVDAIEKIGNQRIDVSEDIKKAGFDIKNSAQWLTNFYEGLANE